MTSPNDAIISTACPDIKEIVSISPSKYLSAKRCSLSYILEKSNFWQYMPRTAAGEVGTVIHKLIEWAGKSDANEISSEDASHKFDELIKDAERRLSLHPINIRLIPLRTTDRAYPQKRQRAINSAIRGPKGSDDWAENQFSVRSEITCSVQSPLVTKMPVGSLHEKTFSSIDGLISGNVDRINITHDTLEIIDEKSCLVIDEEGHVKEEYRMQLLLYAGIVYETLNRMPTKLILSDINNEFQFLDFSFDEVIDELKIARRWLAAVNKKISNSKTINDLVELAQPSAKACRYCKSRPACPAYWNARRTKVDEWPEDGDLKVESITELENGGVLIRGVSFNSTKSIKIPPADIPRQPAIPQITKGSQIRLMDGRLQGTQFSLNARSVIFIIN